MPAVASNVAEYTVSGIAAALKRTVEDAFGQVRVRGEISGYRGPHSSGHAYFALKDDQARLESVVWRTTLQRLRFKPQEGLEVIATGRLTTFPGQSKYQLVIDSLEPAGVGALMALLEQRRRMLAAEGLFDQARKRRLPSLPRVIGVVTSPSGAVIRDILHRIADRFPVRVVIWPVRVQGETAAAEVAAAIHGFNALAPGGDPPRPDVLIVARGGGSLEDLWAFNEEIVVRAAAGSAIPLVSAVGHETDVTLIDHAADLRAPTPTGAAELTVPVRTELFARLDGCAGRHRVAILRHLGQQRRGFDALLRALPSADGILANPRRSLDELSARLGRSLGANNLVHRGRLDRTAARIGAGGPRRAVERARERLAAVSVRKSRALLVHAERKRGAFERCAQRLRPQPIIERLSNGQRRLGDLDRRRRRAMEQEIAAAWQRLEGLGKLLDAFTLSRESILKRGFALVHRADDSLIHSAQEMPRGGAIEIEFADGRVAAIASMGAAMPRKLRRRSTIANGQGSLFDAPPVAAD